MQRRLWLAALREIGWLSPANARRDDEGVTSWLNALIEADPAPTKVTAQQRAVRGKRNILKDAADRLDDLAFPVRIGITRELTTSAVVRNVANAVRWERWAGKADRYLGVFQR